MFRNLPFVRNYTTRQWSDWWAARKIDWRKQYLETWNHPHRNMISAILERVQWMSLLEMGCGPGANLVNIVKRFPKKQVGGIDVNPEAIAMAAEVFHGAFLKVGSVEDIMMSDNSSDICLTDMCLIYVGPRKIDQVITEIKRVARNYVVFCEFHSESWWARMKLRFSSGLYAYNYRSLLEHHGFYDINLIKMPDSAWPDGDKTQRGFSYIMLAKVPKRK